MSDYLTRLKRSIKSGTAILVLGTGVSKSLSDGADESDWAGLIRSGLLHASGSGGSDRWLEVQEAALELSLEERDVDGLIGVASQMAQKLKGVGLQRYADWLRDDIGGLPLRQPDLGSSLAALGAPLLTTNYDTLLEQSISRGSATWDDIESMRKIMRNDYDGGVGHLHGIWERPESVVLTSADYAQLLEHSSSQLFQQAHYLTKSFVFIGYGDGMADPNFSKLLEWHRRLYPSSSGDHFRLVRESELDAATLFHDNDDIRVISYGRDYSDLPGFLRELAPEAAVEGPIYDGAAYAQEALLEQIRQETVVAEHLPTAQDLTLEDLTVTPVLLPMPHEQFAAARAVDDEFRPQRIDPRSVLNDKKILIVVGEELTGLTTSLRWLLAHAATLHPGVAPLFVDARSCTISSRPLERHVRREALNHRLIDRKNDELPIHALAVDNLKPQTTRSYESTIDDLVNSSADWIVLGCRPGDEIAISDALVDHRLPVEIAYLGKLAQREVVQFARILAPTRAHALSDDVLSVIKREHLPRSPFTVSLLIVLFARGSKPAVHNSETAVLNEYISLMLGRNGQYLDPRWSLDPQNREVVLAALAKLFVRRRRGAVTHHDAVDFIEQIFAELDWPDSAYDTLESFRAMRIIRIDNEVVQFQQSSYLHLFAAKAAIGDDDFLREMLADPLYFAPIVRHYAALVRTSEEVVRGMAALLDGWEIEAPQSPVFVDVQAIEAPREAEGDDEPARPAETDVPGPDANEAEADQPRAAKDDYDYSDDADAVPFPLSDPSTWSRTSRLSWTLDLASRVIRDSDQITDHELKSQVLASALERWGYLLELFVLDDRFGSVVDTVTASMVESGDVKESRKDDVAARMRLLLPGFVVLAGISMSLASRKLLRAFDRLDLGSGDEYQGPVASLLAFEMQEPGWVKRFVATTGRDERAWVRLELLHLIARISYLRQTLTAEDEADLLKFIVETGSLRFSFENNAQRKRWMARYEQTISRERALRKRERLPKGVKAIEAAH